MKAILYLYQNGTLINQKECKTMAEAQTEKRNYLQSFSLVEKSKLDIQAYIKTKNI